MWKTVFRNLKWPYYLKFFKDSLPQILLGQFLNTLIEIECNASGQVFYPIVSPTQPFIQAILLMSVFEQRLCFQIF